MSHDLFVMIALFLSQLYKKHAERKNKIENKKNLIKYSQLKTVLRNNRTLVSDFNNEMIKYNQPVRWIFIHYIIDYILVK